MSFIQDQFIVRGVLTDPIFSHGNTMSFFRPNFTYSSVPEPGTLLLLGGGLLGAVRVMRRKFNL